MTLLLALLVCANCHEEIVNRFAATPMGRTSGPVSVLDQPSGSFFHPLSRTKFEIVPANRQLELRWANQSQPLQFYIGSGRMGRSYAFLDQGYLYQAPVGYYTNRRTWDVPPGYEHDLTPDLSRPITAECLYCHSGRARPKPGTVNLLYDKAAIHGLTCERCHGDGAEHSALVNPRKMSGAARDSICEQCHLAGAVRLPLPGKKLADYRPGQQLSDYLAVFISADAPAGVRVNGHAEALAQSKCRLSAGDKLWCGTCHNPHAVTTDYRAKCLECHTPHNDGDCVACHMPKARALDGGHTVFTDHSILRLPSKHVAHEQVRGLRPYFDQSLPERVKQRNLGLAYAELRTFEKAWPLLRASAAAGLKDPPLYTRIAALLDADGRLDSAEAYYRQSLKMDADQIDAVLGLARVLDRMGRKEEARALKAKAAGMCPRQVAGFR